MNRGIRLNEVALKPKIVDSTHTEWTVTAIGPVWVNPLGVNLTAQHPGAEVTVIRLDCGQTIFVAESWDQVTAWLDSELEFGE